MKNSDGATPRTRYGLSGLPNGHSKNGFGRDLIRVTRCLSCNHLAYCLVEHDLSARSCQRCFDMLWCSECGIKGGYVECATHNDGAFLLSHPEWLTTE